MTMLDRMRRHKGWLKWSLALVVLAFVIFYIPDFLQPQTATVGVMPREIIAEVEGRPLRVTDFQQRYLAQLEAYRSQLGSTVDEALLRQLGIDQQVLQILIEEQVAAIEAERQGIQVSDEELAEEIVSLPVFQESGQFIGQERYRQFLMSQNPPVTTTEFESSFRRDLLIDKLRNALTNWIAVSDEELDREYTRRNERVRLQLVAITPDTFRDEVKVSEEDVAAHYEAHKAEYRVGEQRKVRYLLLDQEQARAKSIVTQAEIQRYYNDNTSLYRTPEQVRASHILFQTAGKDEAEVRARAEEVLKKLQGEADFAALAKQLSEDEGTKASGGDLGYFERGRMVPEFDQVAFELEPGRTSELVRSDVGFHIIRVMDRRAELTRTLDEVRPEIQERLSSQKASEQVGLQAGELATRIDAPDDLDRIARELGTTVQESQYFARDGQIPGLGVSNEAVDAAFRLEDGAVSGPVFTARGPVFLTVTDTLDPHVPKLEDIRERVRADTVRARATELSRERASQVAAALGKSRDFAAAAKSQGVEVQETMLITRGTPLPVIGVSPEVERVAFDLPEGAVSDPIATADGTAIVRVAERDEVTPDELARDREQFRSQLLNERRNLFFQTYMTKARERVNIDIKTEVVQRMLRTMQGTT
jgi:peptidyl-prolyl cis-trans isomerase D